MAKKPKKIDWQARFDKAYKNARDKLEAQKALFTKVPAPFDPTTITAETVIDGKPVSEWSAIYHEEGEVPGWAIWAVRQWEARGKPTRDTTVLDKITALRADAEALVKFASMDKDKAGRIADKKKAAKLLAAAQKKSDKAAALFEEADALAINHKENK